MLPHILVHWFFLQLHSRRTTNLCWAQVNLNFFHAVFLPGAQRGEREKGQETCYGFGIMLDEKWPIYQLQSACMLPKYRYVSPMHWAVFHIILVCFQACIHAMVSLYGLFAKILFPESAHCLLPILPRHPSPCPSLSQHTVASLHA